MSSLENESEYRTRRERIDPMLVAPGWKIVPFDPAVPWSRYTHHAVTEFETANGPADYVLFVAGRPIGIVEAKKVTLGPQNVLVQAERYSRGQHRPLFQPEKTSVAFSGTWLTSVNVRLSLPGRWSRALPSRYTSTTCSESFTSDSLSANTLS